ncbi:hypothetical protein C9374_000350 [Naegleria lovaniensis]|uniref:Uncharacterized protein n=1 Tax=Naegleria lovaniensis TaxID=51637 RepID=A0AA88GZK5_NAELO|nr:uncharacterized protein C9374_000350 [Naegleria lovaniensis]KAG2388911.1 hypothetical protein C9374_000350 [Naegleria lovaniensis]
MRTATFNQTIFQEYIGMNLYFDLNPIDVCQQDHSIREMNISCTDFMNSTWLDLYGNEIQRFLHFSKQWLLRTNESLLSLSKGISLEHTSNGTVRDQVQLLNFCTSCNHSHFEIFHLWLSKELPLLNILLKDNYCGQGIPHFGVSPSSLFIACSCPNGVVSNECGFYSQFLIPFTMGETFYSIEIAVAVMLLIVILFLNFIPYLKELSTSTVSNQKRLGLLMLFTEFKLHSNILLMGSVLSLITCACITISIKIRDNSSTGMRVADIFLNSAGNLLFVSTIPLMFSWVDTIYRSLKLRATTTLSITIVCNSICGVLLALSLGYAAVMFVLCMIDSKHDAYIVISHIPYVFTATIIAGAIVVTIIMTLLGFILFRMLKKSNPSVRLLDYRFTKFLIYIVIVLSPMSIQLSMNIIRVFNIKWSCRFYSVLEYHFIIWDFFFLYLGEMYLLFKAKSFATTSYGQLFMKTVSSLKQTIKQNSLPNSSVDSTPCSAISSNNKKDDHQPNN